MEFRDLFGDQSEEGNFRRVGCLRNITAKESCPHCPDGDLSVCWHAQPRRRTVHVDLGSQALPRSEIRSILQSGDELFLEFDSRTPASDSLLAETSHLLRKLRNTGIGATLSGLSTTDKAKLSRLEWTRP